MKTGCVIGFGASLSEIRPADAIGETRERERSAGDAGSGFDKLTLGRRSLLARLCGRLRVDSVSGEGRGSFHRVQPLVKFFFAKIFL